jgi:hypothetical protein
MDTPAQRKTFFEHQVNRKNSYRIAAIELTILANVSRPQHLNKGEANSQGFLTHPPSEKKELWQDAADLP